ncbi:hypothetical protein GIB67_015160 [Kingdonia uniflora]|uniref:lipoyl(octanoyl) transferase n=1 Tax=Kingdonia uniflora TaxID=39325 RepID=A0A7J7LJH3_9MAGN|nr:hypothetical protein GIB67_015160 [Kingdonia uniflora]
MILCVIPGISLALPCRPHACSVRSLSESNEVGFKIPGADWKTRRETRRCEVFDLHKELVPYREAFSWQESTVRRRQALVEKGEDFSDSLIILQHPPVYTLGTKSSEKNLKFDIKDAPYDIYRTKRGGEVTYHGPGQLVMYPIMNLGYHKMCSHLYMRALEEVVIQALSITFSIEVSRREGLTGVWFGDQKLAAIGIRVASKWVTFQGLALNVTTDLTPFEYIVPCGIPDHQVGSIQRILENSKSSGETIDAGQLIEDACKSLLREFSEVFQLDLS